MFVCLSFGLVYSGTENQKALENLSELIQLYNQHTSKRMPKKQNPTRPFSAPFNACDLFIMVTSHSHVFHLTKLFTERHTHTPNDKSNESVRMKRIEAELKAHKQDQQQNVSVTLAITHSDEFIHGEYMGKMRRRMQQHTN